VAVQEAEVMGHWSAMVRVAHSVVGRHDAAEDCASAAVVQILSKNALHVDNLEALLVTVAKRRAIDMLRAEDRTRRRDAQLAGLERTTVADIAEDVAAQAHARWADQTARQLLQPRVYRLLRLIADEVPVPQVAAELGMTSRAVENHLLRARRVMRRALANALAVLGLLGVGVRRLCRGAATVTVTAAAAVLLLVIPYVRGVGTSPSNPPFAGIPVPAVLQAHHQPGDSTRSPGSAPRDPAGVRRDRDGRATRAESTVVDVAGPAHARAWVTAGDSGTHENGPVEEVVACLENVHIGLEHVGC
jgi:RNA polymerase sigma factor (sigma-70 family)